MTSLTLADKVLDNGLTALLAADRIYACSSEPTTYAGVLSVALGVKNYGAPNLAFGAKQDWAGGRKLVSNEILDTGTANGTANYWAAVDSTTSTLLARGSITTPFGIALNGAWALPSFTIQQSDSDGNYGSTSSAGVFDSTDKLVRELWTFEKNSPKAGNPVAEWDGTLQDGTVAPTDTYTIKLLTHDINYTWEGAIGNSSPNHTDNNVYHNPAAVIFGMAISNNGEIWYSDSYNERFSLLHVKRTDMSGTPSAAYSFDPQYGFDQSYQGGNVHSICTDGYAIYWTEMYGPTLAYICGKTCAAKQNISFGLVGTKIATWGSPGPDSNWSGEFYGIAVQKNGSFLFAAQPETGDGADYYGTGTVTVINKYTGDVLQTDTRFWYPTWMTTNPVTGELWLAYMTARGGSHIVEKFTADVITGFLTTTGVQITTLLNPVAMAVSPDGSTLLISDAAPSDQVKAFNTSNGSVKTAWGTSGTFGTPGGYVNTSIVTDTTFMFAQHDGMGGFGPHSFIAFDLDGSFWLGDSGNCRVQHFSAGNSPTYIEQIAYVPPAYIAQVCHGDPTRVFYHALEFKIDYSKPLEPGNGSWTLSRNWGYDMNAHNQDGYGMFNGVGVYPNGRTYAMRYSNVYGGEMFELTDTGLRNTSVYHDPTNTPDYYNADSIDLDFTLTQVHHIWPPQSKFDTQWNQYVSQYVGNDLQILRNPFVGFDLLGNPLWRDRPYYATDFQPTEVWRTITGIKVTNPRFPLFEIAATRQTMDPLANNVLPIFMGHSGIPTSLLDHVGGFDIDAGTIKFSTHPGTPTPCYGQAGEFGGRGYWYSTWPSDTGVTWFPSIGGDYAGAGMAYLPHDTCIFVGNRGEDWGAGQCNMWHQFHESGLLLGRFGALGMTFAAPSVTSQNWINHVCISGENAQYKGLAGMAGNCVPGGVTKANGKYYIYHTDEWYHSGLHRWRIDNMESLKVSTTAVNWDSANYVILTDPTDMLAGLPRSTSQDALVQTLPSGTAGWIRSQTTDIGTGNSSPAYRVYTSALIFDPRKSPDLVVEATSVPSQTISLYRSLPPGSGNWTLSGAMMVPILGQISVASPNSNTMIWFDILDNTGKLLIRMGFYGTDDLTFPGFSINGNVIDTGKHTIDPFWGTREWGSYIGAIQPFSFVSDITAGTIVARYGAHYQITVTPNDLGGDLTSPSRVSLTYVGGSAASGSGAMSITKLNFIS